MDSEPTTRGRIEYFRGARSTEFVQKHKAAKQNAERDPKMYVGGDGANQVARPVRAHGSLGIGF
jgi:hypothetical protein